MRVLIIHNAYQQRGGEDAVVQAESELLTSRGHEVRHFTRHNDQIDSMPRADLAMQTVWSRPSAQALARELLAFSPDVVHLHNTFPLISPSAYWACAAAAVPLVQTLHNFRLLCPQAMFLRDGRVCEDCLGRVPWRGAVRGCYRGSRAQSAVVVGMLALHRGLGTWRNKVTRYIALNEFCRRKFIEGGLPAERIVVKPNFVDEPAPPLRDRFGFLFVGRLSEEKGVRTLMDASRQLPGVSVRVAGNGPEAPLLDGVPGVARLGPLAADAVRQEMCAAIALVLPSICYEQFPRTLVEAYACGLPVIASGNALAELVEDGVTGLLFTAGNALELATKMQWAQAHPQQMAEMGRRARARYEAEYTAERNYEQLMKIYEDAIGELRGYAAGSATPRA
jgi:glycosyltransferase involved in cell wall biosynthesis